MVYVLDEPSAGLHPADTEALLDALDQLRIAGNSIFVVEHELEVIRRAAWIVDVGPGAGNQGGEVLYSGMPAGLKKIASSATAAFLFNEEPFKLPKPRKSATWLDLTDISLHNLDHVSVSFPLGVLTVVTGVSGSGKSSLISGALVDLVATELGLQRAKEESISLDETTPIFASGRITQGLKTINRLVQVDQQPIGRTPRSNIATYTGLFDAVRKLFASTKLARSRHYDAGQFSFNVEKGRCPNCSGEGFVMVELLFLPSVYSPCPTCGGARFNPNTLEITYHDKNIAEVLNMTVGDAHEFFHEVPAVQRALSVLREVGLSYVRLGQPATELSGGEAQRIKLATELQRIERGKTLYILDEPTTGLHPADVERLVLQLNRLVDAGNTVIVVEHDMRVIAAGDWVIDLGPGAGDEGGKILFSGVASDLIHADGSKTGPYLQRFIQGTLNKNSPKSPQSTSSKSSD